MKGKATPIPTRHPADTASPFPLPVVSEVNGVLTLHFQSDYVQSQMLPANPDFLALTYTRTMMAFELLKPEARHIALIGLGGGSLARWCYRHHPGAALTVVEINPHVISLREKFLVPDDDHRFRILCEDGAQFVERSFHDLDVLLVDVFDVDSLPEALCSESFYENCYQALSEKGLLVVNLCDATRQQAFSRIQRAFHGHAISTRDRDGNIVVYACKGDRLWPETATSTYLARKRTAFEKKHGLSKALTPV
ncbi:fused MFS/spermidine synthase [Silvibacterium sp.]|uniref:fused MFS/spermidine synthase n=1 Tax=Silvibacterium sp. TaxID=1964179 RepID=UPI0039E51169